MRDLLDHDRLQRAIANNERLRLADERARAEAKVRVDQLQEKANRSIMMAEYTRAGLRPPITNAEGFPTVSLALLMQHGWTIEALGGGQKVLLRPATVTIQPRARGGNYEGEGS